jgi:uncharacterized protein (TIGR03032 family)
MSPPAPPFSCSYSPNMPELLWDLNCSLAITTYQAGKLVILSAPTKNELIQLPRTFDKPMGIALSGNRLGIATKDEIHVFADSPNHAAEYPENPKSYDHIYIPRSTHYCGTLDIHDLTWHNNKMIAVTTAFSCISEINDEYNFKPIWHPKFISSINPEDRCHLNGLAIQNNELKYASALGDTDTPQGWRENKHKGGIIIDIPSGETIIRDLAMPHSPRVYNDKLYFLLSATGQLVQGNPENGSCEVVNEFNGFVRGLAKHGDYLFIGLSRIRENSSAFRDLPIAKKSLTSGIVVVYLPMGNIVGHIYYKSSVEEIYDVQVLPEMRRPGMMSLQKNVHKTAIVTPDSSFWTMKSAEGNKV